MGPDRDSGLPHLDDGGRTRLRRRRRCGARHDAAVGVDDVVIPVVGECDDSWLNDARTCRSRAQTSRERVAAAASAETVAEGCRRRGHRHDRVRLEGRDRLVESPRARRSRRRSACSCSPTSARSHDLRIDGVPCSADARRRARTAPHARRELHRGRRHRRPARTRPSSSGSPGAAGSGSPASAPSPTTAAARSSSRSRRLATERDERPPARRRARPSPTATLDALFSAVVEATEEAVLNALWAATDTTGREGRVVRALPHEPVLELLAGPERLGGSLKREVPEEPRLVPGQRLTPLLERQRLRAAKRAYSRPDRRCPRRARRAKAPETTNPTNEIRWSPRTGAVRSRGRRRWTSRPAHRGRPARRRSG